MRKLIKHLTLVTMLAIALVFSASAQVDRRVVVNSDGTYSVIDYPMDKDVTVRLLPMSGIKSTGMAHVYRTANGTKVVFDVTGAPSDWQNVYAYAVDPTGAATLLGPITFTGGAGKAEFMTPNHQFMLVLSPTEGLTTYDPSNSTGYVFRSDVPSGFTVVPRSVVSRTTAVVTDTGGTTTVSYEVPMLGVSKFKGKKQEVRLHFGGDMNGLEAKAYLKPVGGKTQIRMTFDDLQKLPMNKRFVLWTYSPEGYTKIGQIIHAGKKDTAEIRGETALSDFGLFLTVEDTDVDRPTSRIYSTFTVVSPS